jgi:hypothetical protein
MKDIQQWNGCATFSLSSNNNPLLWKMLSINVSPNQSLSAINGDDYIAYSHILYDQKIVYQHFATAPFSGTLCPEIEI